MYHVSTVALTELNQHFICGLCFGYIIDATTIIECPHSFCRSCLLQYLATENCCPLCGQLVHKTKPLDYIRADKNLQDLAYKLIPHLYTSIVIMIIIAVCFIDERQRREAFRLELPETASGTVDNWSDEDRDNEDPVLDTADVNERLSVCLQLADARQPPDHRAKISEKCSDASLKLSTVAFVNFLHRSNDRRYLLCPAYLNLSILKKFIRIKFELSIKHQVAMFYAEEDLPDHYTLTDVATLYGWRRLCPLKLFYIVYNPSRLRHLVADKTSLSYITYRKLIKKHRRRQLRMLRREQTVPDTSSEGGLGELTNVPCTVSEVTSTAASTVVTLSSSTSISSSSSSGCASASVSSSTATSFTSSFTITRLLSLSEDIPEVSETTNTNIGQQSSDNGGDSGKLAASVVTVPSSQSQTTVASQQPPAVSGGSKSPVLGGSVEVRQVPVHFKKRMLSTATTIGGSSGLSTVGQRSFTIHEDAPEDVLAPLSASSTPPAKVGIVISHGRAMTLQDKLQMTRSAGRRSPSSSFRSAGFVEAAAASPLRVLNRNPSVTPAAPFYKLKRRLRPVAKRSLMTASSPKVAGGNENEAGHAQNGADAKRARRKSTKRSELELLLQLDGGIMAASAEFRKASALRARDNILPLGLTSQDCHDVIKTSNADEVASQLTATPATGGSDLQRTFLS